MMRHPVVHIALIILIALVLTLLARSCDGDHQTELADAPSIAEPPLPAPVEPVEQMTPGPSPHKQETRASTKPNPCLKQTPAPEASSPFPAPGSDEGVPETVGRGRSPPPPEPVASPAAPRRSVSVMPYARGTNPCAKGPPPDRGAPAQVPSQSQARSQVSPADGPATVPGRGSLRVLPPAKGSNPCAKSPAGRATALAPPSPAADRTQGGAAPAPSPDHVAAGEDTAGSGEQDDGPSGPGPRLASSLDDGPPMPRRIMRRGGEPAVPPPPSPARLAASMDGGAPSPDRPAAAYADHHEHQHEEGLEHDHETPARAGGGGSSVADHARHVERMKAGGHDDLRHMRVDPPAYPAPEKYHPGRNLYQAHCQSCHGDRGTGTHQAPPLLHPYYDPNDHGDDYFYDAVANGARQHLWDYGDMPPLPHVSRKQVREIISYVRWLQRQANIY